MHSINEIPAWDRLLKRIVWKQIGPINGKRILDFGSGQGITANYFAKRNEVTAIESSEKMLFDSWKDYEYTQIIGDEKNLKEFESNSFDFILCHNVLEYIKDKQLVINELSRLLKKDGTISIVKHNRPGRVMQMAVLLNDLEKANGLLDGKNSTASQFGEIRYYNDEDILKWCPDLNINECLGIRTFWDLQQNQEMHDDESWQKSMMSLEMRCSNIEEYRNIAFFHHLLINKK